MNAASLLAVAIWCCGAGALFVCGAMIYHIARYDPPTDKPRRHRVSEIGWALVPVGIIVASGAFAVGGS